MSSEDRIRPEAVVGGHRKSCSGGAHEKHYAYCDITGQRFDQLTALHPVPRRDARGSVIWCCRCDCGKEVDVAYNSLMYGNQKSCGCRKRAHEQRLSTYLTHVAGTSMDQLKSRKLPSDNTTGCKGVYLIRGKYIAKIVFQKKQYFLGTYDCFEEAVRARRKAEEILFDRVTAHYSRWKERADADPQWAAENPFRVRVEKREGELTVEVLPEIS